MSVMEVRRRFKLGCPSLDFPGQIYGKASPISDTISSRTELLNAANNVPIRRVEAGRVGLCNGLFAIATLHGLRCWQRLRYA